MLLTSRRSQVAASLALIAMFGGVSLSLGSRVATPSVPERVSDEAFWRMVTEFSEPGGFFRSDNFVSNEITFQWVLPELGKTTKTGGVYMGVGPDQNFTYIVAMQPKIALTLGRNEVRCFQSPRRPQALCPCVLRTRVSKVGAECGPNVVHSSLISRRA